MSENNSANSSNGIAVQNGHELKKSVKIQDFPNMNSNHVTQAGITRERSFVRTSNNQNHQNINKRRSLGLHQSQLQQHQQQQQQMRIKPALELYRPPSKNVRIDVPQNMNKLNVHAQEFTMNRNLELQNSRSSVHLYNPPTLNNLQHSKSSGNMHQQIQQMQQHQQQKQNILQQIQQQQQQQQRIILSHSLPMAGITLHQSSHLPLINSPSSGNILHQPSAPRVKFAPDPTVLRQAQKSQYPLQTITNVNNINSNLLKPIMNPNPLQRSKSLSSADVLSRGIASLGLGLNAEDIGMFSPEVTAVINKANEDPNQLTARCLMELATHCMNRAIEGRRYALPISRLCISIISKEKKETFLEALLNTCRQWYQERDKVLGIQPNSKNPARPRFTAFMAFLTEMFCQMKRRQLQLRTQCDGISPAIVLLTLLGKCCEDCVKPPVRSLSEIECLFFVLTCIGRDLEIHLPQQLENLFGGVRDAFLNSSASAPAIRRTLLQLIELQASKWQLPCNTVLYYYPSSK